LQLFIGALRDFAIGKLSTHANKIKRLTVNEDEKEGSPSSFKVWPTNVDRILFESVMLSGNPATLRGQYNLTEKSEMPRLISAYCYFYRQIENFSSGDSADDAATETRIYGLYQALRVGLQVVVIELENNDDPQMIFETLNARGQPLLPSDLIRNTIFHQAFGDTEHYEEENYAESLYNRYWRYFDDDRLKEPIKGDDRYWYVEERQGRLTRPRIDLFIFHFLVMKTGKLELSIGHLFQEFRDWRDVSSDSLESFLADLKRYAFIFRDLVAPSGRDRLARFSRRLRSLDTSTVYPFLMYIDGLPTETLSKSDRDWILEDIESWLIRRLVCQLTNKNYNNFFVGLLNKVRRTVEGVPGENMTLTPSAQQRPLSAEIKAAVRSELTRSKEDTLIWPTDPDFESGWLRAAVYVKSRPDRAVMLLRAIDLEHFPALMNRL
jgi:hypothetical protein